MGNKQTSCRHTYFSRFLPEEQAEIDGLYASITGGVETLSIVKNRKSLPIAVNLQMLQAYIGDALPEKMICRLFEGMRNIHLAECSTGPNEFINKEQFVIMVSELLKGHAAEKSQVIMKMLYVPAENAKQSDILELTEDMITAVVHVLEYRNELKGWNVNKTQDFMSGVKALASQLLSSLKQEEMNPTQQKTHWDDFDGERDWTSPGECPPRAEKDKDNFFCDANMIKEWLLKVPQISSFLNVIIRRGFLVLHSDIELASFIPECKDSPDFTSLFNIPAIMYINSYLPAKLQYTWRLLFSSQIHGYNFAKFCGNIIEKGPCLLVVRDRDGYIFGGFSSVSWTVKGQFQGDSKSFLFTISPNIAVYTYTGFNDHYMYLNFGQQTIPNGLGMGGQFNYFGLWIDYDFGKGHSKANPRCTTYNSPRLSARENFELDSLEVWAVGDFPTEKPSGKKTVLESNSDVQCMLEMIGKTRHGEAFLEPVKDEETQE